MSTRIMNSVPNENDVVDAINRVIDDYFAGIKNTASAFEEELKGWTAQIVAFAADFNGRFDEEFAVVTAATLEELEQYDGPLAPILLNSTRLVVQTFDDAANGKLSVADADARLLEVYDAFKSDVKALSELSEEELVDELFLTKIVGAKVIEAVRPVLKDATDALGNAIKSYISTFVEGVEVGTEGDDALDGGFGNNTMLGMGGNDAMDGGWGNDKMFGGAGSDKMQGGFGHDEMRGGLNDDEMSGGSGNDHMFGDAGADTIDGGQGDDRIEGGAGNDTLDGGANSDAISGGDGADLIIGGYGNDTLTGGEGGDTFVFGDFSGRDVITDWEAGVDVIEIAGLTWNFGNLHIRQNGDDAEIFYGFATIVLEDTDGSALSAADFDFV